MHKLLFITSSYPFGKGESFIVPEIEYLSKKYNVDVLPTHPRGKAENRVSISGSYLDLSLFSFTYFLSTLLFLVSNPFKFFKLLQLCNSTTVKKTIHNLVLIPKAIYVSQCYLKKDKYAFIYCHWLSAPTQLGLLLSMLTDTPFGVTGHRWDLIDNNNLEQKMKYAKFIRLISEKSKTLLPATTFEKYQSKVHVIYLGVDINKIHFKKRETKLIYTGVCVASLIAVKGHIYLLNALKIIHEKGYKVKLKIIGDGVLKEQLIALTQSLNIQDYVEFYGNLPHETVIKLLASGDIDFCCLPSVDLGNGLHEGIPVSLMEAMNYGIPCVSTDTGSINELITSNKNGLLVQDKNPLLIAQAIIKLLDDNVFTESIIQNAIDNLKSNFDSQKNNQRLYSLIAKK